MAYENGVAKLQQQAKQDLLWFLCKVVPTVQKTFKPLWVDEKGQEYYQRVLPSNEAFAFVCMKNYQKIPDYTMQKILKIDKIQETKKNDNEEDNKGQEDVNALEEEKTPEEKKKKLSGKKLQLAMSEYDDWHRKFTDIRKNKLCILANDIQMHSKQMAEKKKKKQTVSLLYQRFPQCGDDESCSRRSLM